MKKAVFRKAHAHEASEIWKILQGAILRRKKDGSTQWQNGYPNLNIVQEDIAQEFGYILKEGNSIIAYCAVLKNDEPAYNNIEGKWLSDGDFLVVHRLAVAEEFLGKGWAKQIFLEIENLAIHQKIPSIKVDTNFDNDAMLYILEKLNYQYCGIVLMNGSSRKAFEKILKDKF